MNHLRNAVQVASDDDGWASFASFGDSITKQHPDFDSRSYGYAKLSDLMGATTLFEVDRRSPSDGKPGVIYPCHYDQSGASASTACYGLAG